MPERAEYPNESKGEKYPKSTQKQEDIMAVVIRLQRTGKRTQPQYRVIAAEKRSGVGSQAKEVLGTFNPCVKEAEQIKLDLERVNHWVKVGAIPSKTVAALIKKASK